MIFDPPVIAHRGASAQAPENTFAAFKKAKALGLQWVEFDVRLSASGDLVIFHDDCLERTTNGFGKVIQHPYQYIKTLDAGQWFSYDYKNERVPTLPDLLVYLSELGLSANLEIKSSPGYEELLTQYVIKIIEKSPKIPMLISSFSREVLTLVKQTSSPLDVGFLMHRWEEDWEKIFDDINAQAIHISDNMVTPARVIELKRKKCPLLVYTIDNPDRANVLFDLGVDAVFSNCPVDFNIAYQK